MKSFKYTINGNVYKVHINSVVDDIADVEVNGTPYQVKLEKPAKKQMVTLKRPAQADNSKWRPCSYSSGSLYYTRCC